VNRRNRRGRNPTDRSNRRRPTTSASPRNPGLHPRCASWRRGTLHQLIGPSSAARLRAAPAEMIESGARSAFAAQALSRACARRRATPTLLSRTPSVASTWRCRLERPTLPRWRTTSFTHPPGKRCFRERPPPDDPTCAEPPGFQGRLPLPSAKRRAIRRAQGAFRRGETRRQ